MNWRIERRSKINDVWGDWVVLETEITLEPDELEYYSYCDEHSFTSGREYQYRVKNVTEDSIWIYATITPTMLLYFIDEPSVQTQPPIATHVMVKSPTHSYIASLEGVSSDQRVDKKITIASGNTAICKVVAERLLERWGTEQVSITGKVAFNVGLRFKEKVKVIIPTAGINGDYILQRKAHNLADFSTVVVVGDIILSEEELVARILQDLEVETGAGSGEPGPQGPPGDDGDDGAVWHSGAGAPSSGLGSPGHYYLNTNNGDVYRKNGSWAIVMNIEGPEGPQGPQGLQGPKGDDGDDGVSLQYNWSNTQLGIKREDEGSYTYTDLEGPQGLQGEPGPEGPEGPIGPEGPQGDKGDEPAHQWSDTSLRFQNPDGTWGTYTDLEGPAGTADMSIHGNDFHNPNFAEATHVTEDETDDVHGYTTYIGTKLYDNAGAHNAIYRGKFLGTEYTQAQSDAIAAGTFDDLYIGDYWIIGGVNYYIAAFDYFYNVGDHELTTHHAVIVPDTTFGNEQMEETNITTNGYSGSQMRVTNIATAKTACKEAFSIGTSVKVINHRQLLCNASSNGNASGWAWADCEVELMNEVMVYGSVAWGTGGGISGYNVGTSHGRLPLFALRHDLVNIRTTYWLRDVVSATNFARVTNDGVASSATASNSFGVRPVFSIS